MPELYIDGQRISVAAGTSVAAALALAGDGCSRSALNGTRRAPLCGMGVCQECRVSIDGQRRLACQTPCRDGMRVETRR
ncbi:2Fe-2S iron-sulfur cluster-binding protein [Plasticicumulans acidivorans]|uniref:2Fe-2S iron-sulfur cluster protein n=1 Tax=Plasticicumulans acidivorans TaxID=886464 RepID=A0A317MYI1_9GAMM|nr:2Fe-2S iron-sulfur cluster-binding protein [Plasticicumulans acidivorans]PWV64422.1 2Fe-2S iron-sulfur cluster protein [Plasticicumulans acidivorans]